MARRTTEKTVQTKGNISSSSKVLKGARIKKDYTVARSRPDHEAVLVRLNRAVGQIKGVSAMIHEGRYCIDILNQLKAAHAALKSAEAEIMKTHIRNSIQDTFTSKNLKEMDGKIKELIKLMN